MSHVIWTERNLLLRVLGEKTGDMGERRLIVCKSECPNPLMGRFSVRADAVVPA